MELWSLIGVLVLLMVGITACVAIARALVSARERTVRFTSLSSHGCVSLWPESWLAVKSRSLVAVQSALNLHDPRACSWLEGFTSADQLFIAPPVQGWILVTGAGLPSPSEDVDACFRFVLALSHELGHVQFFVANRTLDHHAWVKAQNGRIVRAYAWVGTTVWHQGLRTRPETELGLRCLDYAEPDQADESNPTQPILANVDKVYLLAARWGLDPRLVQQHFPSNERGIAGRPVRRY